MNLGEAFSKGEVCKWSKYQIIFLNPCFQPFYELKKKGAGFTVNLFYEFFLLLVFI